MSVRKPRLSMEKGIVSNKEEDRSSGPHVEHEKEVDDVECQDNLEGAVNWTKKQIGAVMSLSMLWVGQ